MLRTLAVQGPCGNPHRNLGPFLRFVRAGRNATGERKRLRSRGTDIIPVHLPQRGDRGAGVATRSRDFPQLGPCAPRQEGRFCSSGSPRRHLHRRVERSQHRLPSLAVAPPPRVGPESLERAFSRLQLARLHRARRNGSGRVWEDGKNAGEEERAHARTLAQATDPSIVAPTPPYAHRYLRMPDAANRQRESRAASRHRRLRAASRATDQARSAIAAMNTSALIAAPPRRPAGRAGRGPRFPERP